MAIHAFHLGDPVTFEIGGVCYKGAFQRCKGWKDAEVLVTEQGGKQTSLCMLVGVSSIHPLRDKVGVE